MKRTKKADRASGIRGGSSRLKKKMSDPLQNSDASFQPPTFELGNALLNGKASPRDFNGGYQGSSETSEPDLLVLHLMSAGNFSREEAERWAEMI